jgi:hypothetical protein
VMEFAFSSLLFLRSLALFVFFVFVRFCSVLLFRPGRVFCFFFGLLLWLCWSVGLSVSWFLCFWFVLSGSAVCWNGDSLQGFGRIVQFAEQSWSICRMAEWQKSQNRTIRTIAQFAQFGESQKSPWTTRTLCHTSSCRKGWKPVLEGFETAALRRRVEKRGGDGVLGCGVWVGLGVNCGGWRGGEVATGGDGWPKVTAGETERHQTSGKCWRRGGHRRRDVELSKSQRHRFPPPTFLGLNCSLLSPPVLEKRLTRNPAQKTCYPLG